MIFKDHLGKEYEVEPGTVQIKWRIAAYGVVLNEHNEVLMLQPHGTSHWQFPGGGVEMDESIDEALKREFLEEVGYKIDPEQKELLYFKESNFKYTKSEEHFHSLQLTFKVVLAEVHQFKELIERVEDNDYGEVMWKNIKSLEEKNIQHTHWPIVKMLKSKDSRQAGMTGF